MADNLDSPVRVARVPTPLFNSPDLHKIFTWPLPLDEQKLLRPLETVLFPGSLVSVAQQCQHHVVQIVTEEYPGDKLYTDSRFLEVSKNLETRKKTLPSLQEILKKLQYWPKTDYVWGGNFSNGIPQLEQWYPMPKGIDEQMHNMWLLMGVDCSGLLYEVTQGYTPRNTAQLMHFGDPVSIEGKSDEEIIQIVLPGDLIIWRGHMLIVEEGGTVFESRIYDGTIRTSLVQRLKEIRQTREPVDDPTKDHKTSYVVRRWYF
ncbi:MAG: hypothetical protein KGZ39_02435 [Simkania sp.]|nr:hypothetical protein [Simkania sp.]